MALVESLACGTPVVGCNHAGIRDIITDPAVGMLCEPGSLRGEMNNVSGLSKAILEAIELSRNPLTIERCRQHAERFGWTVCGPKLEALYK